MQKREPSARKEIATGAIQSPFRIRDVNLDSIAVHPTFRVWERCPSKSWKGRIIENLKACDGNDTVESVESYTLVKLDVACSVPRFEKELWSPNVKLAGFTSD